MKIPIFYQSTDKCNQISYEFLSGLGLILFYILQREEAERKQKEEAERMEKERIEKIKRDDEERTERKKVFNITK